MTVQTPFLSSPLSILAGLVLSLVSMVCISFVAQPAYAQESDVPVDVAADSADVHSIGAIMAAVYDAISGPASEERDWARFRSLFAPGARLIPLRKLEDGTVAPVVMTVDEYAERAAPFFSREGGFFEREIASRTERYGHIAHVFSTYASFREGESEPFVRGINSFQLLYDGLRWWIVSIYWDSETPDRPIPDVYLP